MVAGGGVSLLAAFDAAPEPPGLGLANELKEAESPTSTIESRAFIHAPSASAAIACGTLGSSANRNSSRRLSSGTARPIGDDVRAAQHARASRPRAAPPNTRPGFAARARLRRPSAGTGLSRSGASTLACASISASSAAVCAFWRPFIVRPFARAREKRSACAAARSSSNALSPLLRGDQPDGRIQAAAIVGHDHADELAEDPVIVVTDVVLLDERVEGRPAASTARPSCEPAASAPRTGQLDLFGVVLAAEQQHLDHLPGCLLATGTLPNRRPQLIEARRPVTRSRSWRTASERASAPGLRANRSR